MGPCRAQASGIRQADEAEHEREHEETDSACDHAEQRDGDQRADHPHQLETRFEARERAAAHLVGPVALHETVERELARARTERQRGRRDAARMVSSRTRRRSNGATTTPRNPPAALAMSTTPNQSAPSWLRFNENAAKNVRKPTAPRNTAIAVAARVIVGMLSSAFSKLRSAGATERALSIRSASTAPNANTTIAR
jgi:hypothetical protein